MNKLKIFWVPVVIKKTSILLFILASIVLITFFIGNFQEFLDSTQLLLLNILGLLAILYIIIGFYNIIFTIIRLIKFKSREYLNFGLIITGEIFIIIIYILVKMISIVTISVN
jgi:hypothetical protein